VTPAEQQRRFNAERRAQLAAALRLRKATYAEIVAELAAASREIAAILARQPTDYQRWQLPQLQAAIARALRETETAMAATASAAVGAQVSAGAALVTAPLASAGVAVAATLPLVSVAGLGGLQATTTRLIVGITQAARRQIEVALAQTIIGAQPVGATVAAVQAALEVGGRSRALTIVRTELGRAYSAASQSTMAQAAGTLPGLKKQWRRSGKLHSRLAHDAIDGQIRAVDEPFDLPSGVQLLYPRDPTGPAGETINCGCESLPWMDGWEVATPGPREYSTEELFRKGAFSDARGLPAPGWAAGSPLPAG